ncbi:PaaI family thioesterase [Stutzerimonas stutzeri]|uniref:PaaI family thioesterase n=1 Tax=Stutzerimonas stutzeri TaxID=316 RepID=UPI002109B6A4|nr:PaaI family thioesterase [Stutzerimonas stutzeri]MCQ4258130.1 PaaI family thioesterase [Stutzerimonas stutzeri]
MNYADREARLAAWLDAEEAIRARMGPVGTVPPSKALGLAPLDFFEAIGRGELPRPAMGDLMDFVPVEWAPGYFVFQGTPDERHYNPLGSVHGGYAATLLDSCMGCAVHTRLEAGQGYTTTDLRTTYIRALRAGVGPVRAEGRVVHVGRSTAVAEGRLYDVDDRLYAIGSTSCLILGAGA